MLGSAQERWTDRGQPTLLHFRNFLAPTLLAAEEARGNDTAVALARERVGSLHVDRRVGQNPQAVCHREGLAGYEAQYPMFLPPWGRNIIAHISDSFLLTEQDVPRPGSLMSSTMRSRVLAAE